MNTMVQSRGGSLVLVGTRCVSGGFGCISMAIRIKNKVQTYMVDISEFTTRLKL